MTCRNGASSCTFRSPRLLGVAKKAVEHLLDLRQVVRDLARDLADEHLFLCLARHLVESRQLGLGRQGRASDAVARILAAITSTWCVKLLSRYWRFSCAFWASRMAVAFSIASASPWREGVCASEVATSAIACTSRR
jgi:hypothetical protein